MSSKFRYSNPKSKFDTGGNSVLSSCSEQTHADGREESNCKICKFKSHFF